ncbi:hypothetical protein BD779DRAFT_1801834 [Infundibulicybe gibba]|nr:hypothetical protein BD779DRAFT_1801834 [Infundibulicybe gibba]
MPIETSNNPHDIPRKTFHEGVAFSELYGHSDGDGLTCGIFHVEGDPKTAIDNPYGVVGVVTEGVVVLVDSDAPNDRHEVKQGQVFHITKGSTFQCGAGSNGKAFYAIQKPIDHEITQRLKRPVF